MSSRMWFIFRVLVVVLSVMTISGKAIPLSDQESSDDKIVNMDTLYEPFFKNFNDLDLTRNDITKLCLNLIYARNLNILNDDLLEFACFNIYARLLLDNENDGNRLNNSPRARRFFALPPPIDRNKLKLDFSQSETANTGFKYGK
jgi:hypothetical protein